MGKLPRGCCRVVQLEKFAERPEQELQGILQWLGVGGLERVLPAAWDAWMLALHPDPDRKYSQQYLAELAGGGRVAAEHKRIIADFGARVAAVSNYSLDELP